MRTAIKSYSVGSHLFAIEAEESIFSQLSNYTPFETDKISETHVFIIHVSDEPIPLTEGWQSIHIDKADEDMPRIEMYRKDGEWLFLISMYRESEIVCALHCTADWSDVKVSMKSGYERFAINNAAMLAYAFRTTTMHTLLIHASVIVRDGKGYLFVGHSGIGKSTHSQMWLEAFTDAYLLNDDNPVVRLFDEGSVYVYGSPWSGKTACYINKKAPVAALVQLAQAPYNKIELLRMTQAYPYILSSVSGLKIMPDAMNDISKSITMLLECCPVYCLECLPNRDAARLCAQTCSL